MNKKKYILIFSILIFLFASCNKSVRYIYDGEQDVDSTYMYQVKSSKYKLKPNDVLHIQISTTDEEISKLFKVGDLGGNNSRSNNGGEFYLSGFTVNDTGYVQVPILGFIPAAGKTVAEFREDVTRRTHEYLTDAIVNVKFVSFKISFLGEVNRKGPIYIYQDNIDILEAVARAGGVTEYANIKKVTVVRKEEDKRIVYNLDLSDRNLLTSQKFYLYPDDIIIIEPVKAKIAQVNIKEYMFFLSAISSALTTVVLVLNLLGQ
ncbi:MAG: polysaccharide export protein [Chlorobi bacterium]|nr:polysaccharide export protein [Chlorobiota bacterium]